MRRMPAAAPESESLALCFISKSTALRACVEVRQYSLLLLRRLNCANEQNQTELLHRALASFRELKIVIASPE